MGAKVSVFSNLQLSGGAEAGGDIDEALLQEHEKSRIAAKKVSISSELQVAHFMPSSFPLIPVVYEKRISKIQASWKIITENTTAKGSGIITSGITQFYDEFYSRLTIHDAMGLFEAILVKHSAGKNTIAAKGAIILRIMTFILRLDFASANILDTLQKLGRAHNKMGIRPWMYSAFVQTLLLTIASRLGHRATHDVMEAWVNVFAFVLKSMLPAAIRGLAQNDEMTMTSVIQRDPSQDGGNGSISITPNSINKDQTRASVDLRNSNAAGNSADGSRNMKKKSKQSGRKRFSSLGTGKVAVDQSDTPQRGNS